MESLEARKVLQEIDPKLHIEVSKKLGITRKVFYLIKNREITPLTYKQCKKDKFYFDKDEVDKVRKSRKEKQKYKVTSKIKRIVEQQNYNLNNNSGILVILNRG
jgi:hypothetical protein